MPAHRPLPYHGAVHHRFTADLEAGPGAVFAVVSDLGTYAEWLGIVQRVEVDPGSDGGAWFVTLRAKLGPLARSKRLRMIRTVADEPTSARFERAELDGRDHAAWILSAELAPGRAPTSTRLTMDLSYGGRLWTSALRPILDAQVATATAKLNELATESVT